MDDKSYLLTVIDRYSRWPEAIPMANITAATTAANFIDGWISRFGVPTRLTSDQGRQFTSTLFGTLNERLGVDHLRTTPYHPQSNGLVERFHRSLKASLRCHPDETWLHALPMTMLSLRAQLKADLWRVPRAIGIWDNASPAGRVFPRSSRDNPARVHREVGADDEGAPANDCVGPQHQEGNL